MKQSKFICRILSVLLAFCFCIASAAPQAVLTANGAEYDNNYESLSNEEKQAYLEQQLKEVNKKLEDLAGQSKDTEEYINALDEKIKYMKNQLTLAEEKIEDSKNEIETLQRQYAENEEKIPVLQAEIEELSEQSEILREKFALSYEQYCQRARAMYVSGNMTVVEILLTSSDVSMLLTRLEMIRRVSQNDKKLLEDLQAQGEKLNNTQKELTEKKESLSSNQQSLITTQKTLNGTVENLEKQQAEYTAYQEDYETEKTEADSLLLKIQEETETYSEYRHQDQEELDEINREIEAAAEKYLQQQAETTVATTAATKDKATEASGSTGTTSTTAKTTATASSDKLSMIYPVPSQTTITTAFGSAGYAGHTGVDFACSTGSEVVAAESGTVIISTDLTNSDGTYRSYGRYIVIAHDKKNSSGNTVYTLYAHNSSRVVSAGQYVKKGQLIAYSGSTGNSTGPHCHFEVRTPTASYSDCVNPVYYLP